MATTSLQTALSNVEAELAEITANPQPTYSIRGQSVSHDDHLRALLDAQERLLGMLIRSQGPFEERTVGVT